MNIQALAKYVLFRTTRMEEVWKVNIEAMKVLEKRLIIDVKTIKELLQVRKGMLLIIWNF